MAPAKFIFNVFLQMCNHNRNVKHVLEEEFAKTGQTSPLGRAQFKAPERQNFTSLAQPSTQPDADAAMQQQEQQQDEEQEEEEEQQEQEFENEMDEQRGEETELGVEEEDESAHASAYQQYRKIIESTIRGIGLGKRKRKPSRYDDFENID